MTKATTTSFTVNVRSPWPVCVAYRRARAADEMLLRLVRMATHRDLDILDLFLTDEGDWYLVVEEANPDSLSRIYGAVPDPYVFTWYRGEALLSEGADAYDAAMNLDLDAFTWRRG